jgi:hypothetical protein
MVSRSVREQLGPEATLGVIEMLESERVEILQMAETRFDRHVAVEITGLRLELHDGLAVVRQEIALGFSAVRQEMATSRVELLKWSFGFWLGQVAVIAGLMAFMLRKL